MSSPTLITRAAAAGIVTAVTATLLGAAPVRAGTGSTTYDCVFPAPLGTRPIPVATTIPDLPPMTPGTSVPAGSLDPSFVFDATSITSVLGVLHDPSTTGMGLGLDGATVPLSGFSFGDLDGASLPASATSGAFAAPEAPGDYPITMPTSFDLVGTLGIAPLDVACTSSAPAAIGTLTVLGEEPAVSQSTTDASVAKKRIRTGRKATVTATVTLTPISLIPATGDVVVKKRRKTIGRGTLDESSAVTIRTKAFRKPGRYTLKVKYLGEPPLISGSKDTVVLRVKRRR